MEYSEEPFKLLKICSNSSFVSFTCLELQAPPSLTIIETSQALGRAVNFGSQCRHSLRQPTSCSRAVELASPPYAIKPSATLVSRQRKSFSLLLAFSNSLPILLNFIKILSDSPSPIKRSAHYLELHATNHLGLPIADSTRPLSGLCPSRISRSLLLPHYPTFTTELNFSTPSPEHFDSHSHSLTPLSVSISSCIPMFMNTFVPSLL